MRRARSWRRAEVLAVTSEVGPVAIEPDEHVFHAEIWEYSPEQPGSWHFLTLPEEVAEDVAFEAGDLLFFRENASDRQITHVGVSLGGWTMVHSSRGRNGVYIDDVQQREQLKQIFVSAGSFLP